MPFDVSRKIEKCVREFRKSSVFALRRFTCLFFFFFLIKAGIKDCELNLFLDIIVIKMKIQDPGDDIF